MQIVTGKYNTAKVFIDNCEDTCIEQIRSLLDQEPFRDAKVRIMPDCHAGKSCVIGFTADLGDKIIPNIVGVDIGCGMLTVELGKVDIDFVRLDEVIRTYVPSGREVNEGRLMRFSTPTPSSARRKPSSIDCFPRWSTRWATLSPN